jgi:hypothetical protein
MNYLVYNRTFYVRIKVLQKKIYLLAFLRKTKKKSHGMLFWSSKVCPFYTCHKKDHFFAKLCVERSNVLMCSQIFFEICKQLQI